MTELIIALTVIFSLAGFGLSTWSMRKITNTSAPEISIDDVALLGLDDIEAQAAIIALSKAGITAEQTRENFKEFVAELIAKEIQSKASNETSEIDV